MKLARSDAFGLSSLRTELGTFDETTQAFCETLSMHAGCVGM